MMSASGIEKTIPTMTTPHRIAMITNIVISRGMTAICRDIADLLAPGPQVGGAVRLYLLNTALDAFDSPLHALQARVEAQIVLRGRVPERLNLGEHLLAQRVEGALHAGIRLRARLQLHLRDPASVLDPFGEDPGAASDGDDSNDHILKRHVPCPLVKLPQWDTVASGVSLPCEHLWYCWYPFRSRAALILLRAAPYAVRLCRSSGRTAWSYREGCEPPHAGRRPPRARRHRLHCGDASASPASCGDGWSRWRSAGC